MAIVLSDLGLSLLNSILAEPRTRGLDIDDPRTTLLRRQVIRDKPFLRRIYEEWYGLLAEQAPEMALPALELGSGPGFLKEYVPRLITSEIFPVAGIDLVADGHRLPFADGSLRAILMTDVLHHLPSPRAFFGEAVRTLVSGGVVAMTEPWPTPWSTFVYQHFHHEPFDPESSTWEFPSSGPLSGANGALPWIVFRRDLEQFRREFPELEVAEVRPIMPLRYLLSGGLSIRALTPGWTFSIWRGVERVLSPGMAMFALIVLRRR